MTAPVLVTRPSPDGERTVEALRQAGVDARHTPLMQIRFEEAPLPEGPFGALAFTSANGVRAWAQLRDRPNLPAFCVGPASAEAAAGAGINVIATGAPDVAALAELILSTVDQEPILHVRGQDQAGDLVKLLRDGGKVAEAIALYKAETVTKLPSQMAQTITASPATIALFSPRTARLFLTLFERSDIAPSHPLTAACLSEAVAAELVAGPFDEIFVAPAPTLTAFVDRLKSACP